MIGNRTVPIEFGQIYEQSSEFSNGETDGLMGLAYSSLSNTIPIFDSIVSELNIPNIFSMCFNEDGGSLLFGGYNSIYSLDTISWTRIIHESYYMIWLNGISVNGRDLNVNYPPTIIDTGTTLMLFPNNIYNAWKTSMQHNNCHIEGLCGENSIFRKDSCWFFDDSTIKLFPTFEFTFQSQESNDITITLTPDMYFLDLTSNRGTKCKYLGVSPNDQQFVVLGGTFLRNFHTIYDRENRLFGLSRVNKTSCSESSRNSVGTKILNSGLRSFIIVILMTLFMGVILYACNYVNTLIYKRKIESHGELNEIKLLEVKSI